MIKETLEEMEQRFKKSVEHTSRELARLRAGRASPSLLDKITVDYYGTPTPITQLATILAPEARVLLVRPWDKGLIRDIQKAISQSELGLMPQNLGEVLRIDIPALSEERRLEIVKLVNHQAEEGKIALRNIRRETMEKLKGSKEAGTISEDEFMRAQEQVQELVEKYTDEIDELRAAREEEIMGG